MIDGKARLPLGDLVAVSRLRRRDEQLVGYAACSVGVPPRYAARGAERGNQESYGRCDEEEQSE
jgi:hypothetical protein